jgi:hypothetical protein
MKLQLLILPLLVAASASAAHAPVIVTGWDSPTPGEFRQHLAEFEKWGVFDGTTIRPTRRVANGKVLDARFAFSRDPWRWDEFAPALADLRAAKPATCRETYLMLYANPGDVDWFDDAGWREVVNHWRLLARLAKRGSLRGLLYDAEPYQPPHSQFLYAAQPERARHTFAEYSAKARERGRDVMRAVAKEFPDATVFTFRLFSDLLQLLDSGNLPRALEYDTYGLHPPFVDGWMEAAPAGLRIIEGTEDIGYRANSPEEYNAAFVRQRLRLPEFLAPENRDKFSRQLRIGQSLYLDAYVNPPGSPWSIDHTGSTPARRLASNLESALAASDGLVWLYGEQARWWPGGDAQAKMWPEKLPGAVEAIRRAEDPVAVARRFFAAPQPPVNLLTNGDFSQTGPAAPAGWSAWQADNSHGVITNAEGRVEIRGAREAVVNRAVQVPADATLAVRLRVKSVGRGLGSLFVAWQTADGKWTAHAHNTRFLPARPTAADGWQEIVGLVKVPAGAQRAVFMAAASAQTGDADRCYFDDAALAIFE